jgi:hypothetical protein
MVGAAGVVIIPANQLDFAAHSHPARQRARWLDANSPIQGEPDQLPSFGWFMVELLAGLAKLL